MLHIACLVRWLLCIIIFFFFIFFFFFFFFWGCIIKFIFPKRMLAVYIVLSVACISLFLALVFVLHTVTKSLRYLQRQSRWYYMRNLEFAERNRHAIERINVSTGGCLGDGFFTGFDKDRKGHLSVVEMPDTCELVLQPEHYCPICCTGNACKGPVCGKKPIANDARKASAARKAL